EPWEVLRDRILTGFESIAQDLEKKGGGNALVVSHGMTIATLVNLLQPDSPTNLFLDNGSITVLPYETGDFTIDAVGDL
ncbi:histidine phosphatase family protein, partial [Streptococcus suis]